MPKQTKRITVGELLDGLTPERRVTMDRLRKLIRKALPKGYQEAVSKGMLVYQVPLEAYPETYNGQPLWYVAVASLKSYLSLYLMPAYGDPALAKLLADGFKKAGKKLDMGKSCIHFRSADDLALDVIAEIISRVPMQRWIAIAEAARRR